MQHISLKNRYQIEFTSLEDLIEQDNVDAFVDKLELLKLGFATIVAQQAIVNSNDKGTTKDYFVTNFSYHKETGSYTCPKNQMLTTTGTWYTMKRDSGSHQFKKY